MRIEEKETTPGLERPAASGEVRSESPVTQAILQHQVIIASTAEKVAAAQKQVDVLLKKVVGLEKTIKEIDEALANKLKEEFDDYNEMKQDQILMRAEIVLLRKQVKNITEAPPVKVKTMDIDAIYGKK